VRIGDAAPSQAITQSALSWLRTFRVPDGQFRNRFHLCHDHSALFACRRANFRLGLPFSLEFPGRPVNQVLLPCNIAAD